MTRRILTSLKGVTVDDVTSRDRLRQIRDGVDSVNNKIVTLINKCFNSPPGIFKDKIFSQLE